MSPILFRNVSDKDKAAAVERLVVESTPRPDFFFLMILAVFMATFGLLTNSAAVIIGSMLIAPLLSPILSLAMGVVMADNRVIMRSALTTLKAVAFCVPAAAIVALFYLPHFTLDPVMNQEIMSRTQVGLASAAVALIAGLAASFALTKPHLSATLPGVAISVSLLPPLAVTGIGITWLDWTMIANSLILFLVNAGCVVFAGMTIFSLERFYTKQRVARKAAAEEDKKMEKEVEQAKKEDEKLDKEVEKSTNKE